MINQVLVISPDDEAICVYQHKRQLVVLLINILIRLH